MSAYALPHWDGFTTPEEFVAERQKLVGTWTGIEALAGTDGWEWPVPYPVMLANHRALLVALTAREALLRVRTRQAARRRPPCCSPAPGPMCPQHAAMAGNSTGPRKKGLMGSAAVGYRHDELRRATGRDGLRNNGSKDAGGE